MLVSIVACRYYVRYSVANLSSISLNVYSSCSAASCRCRGVRLCRVEHPLWVAVVQRGRREVELRRVAGVGGVVGSRFDHDEEDDQLVFFLLT